MQMKIKDKEEIIRIILLLTGKEVLPEKKVLNLLKTIEKETRKESNIYRESFFSEPSFYRDIIGIGEKYIDSNSIVEQILWILGQICWRYNIQDDSIFEFFIEQIKNPNKKVLLALESGIIFMPQFESFAKKWDFILKMPTIPPKNESVRLFRIAIDKNASNIPEEFKSKIIQVLNNFISTKELDIDTLNLYKSTMSKI